MSYGFSLDPSTPGGSSSSSNVGTPQSAYNKMFYDPHASVPTSFFVVPNGPTTTVGGTAISPPNAASMLHRGSLPSIMNPRTDDMHAGDEDPMKRRGLERFFATEHGDDSVAAADARHVREYSDEFSPDHDHDHDFDVKFEDNMFDGEVGVVGEDVEQQQMQMNAAQSLARYDVVLEAPTAAAPRTADGPLTYLNKGQYYAINFSDKLKKDVANNTAIRIRFHEQQHQLEKTENWRTWLSQQPSRAARPIEIDKLGSTGIRQVDASEFDTIRFQWNGQRNAKVLIRLNCLSTEFSRTKGVKGIPLRIQVETEDEHNDHEYCYCRVKIFRDKGAQRKNRDDQKAVEKKLEKLSRDTTVDKNGRTRLENFEQMFASSVPLTRFATDYEHTGTSPIPSSNDPPSPASSTNTDNSKNNRARKFDYIDLADLEIEPTVALGSSVLGGGSISGLSSTGGSASGSLVRKKKKPLLCLLIKTPEDPMYSGIFLEKLTLDDLRAKIAERYNLDINSITSICRITKRGLTVKVDDKMVESFEEEQDFIMESQFNNVDGTLLINLR